MSKQYKYLFGPVPSRRLGRSLGVDLVPYKTCTMNCVFCQLGDSECTVSERKPYVPIADVLAELDDWKASGGTADHITLAGSGEPTLHVDFGKVLQWIRDNTEIPSVLLTNGSLLYLPGVRSSAVLADKVKVTLSAWDELTFKQIHNPSIGITFKKLVEGETAFRDQFNGELSVEVFIVDGVNSSTEDIKKISKVVKSIRPDRIDLNTAIRPPADPSVKAVTKEHLEGLTKLFSPEAVVAASFRAAADSVVEVSKDRLLGSIQRHPATAQQLVDESGASPEDVAALLAQLVEEGAIQSELRDGEKFYICRS